MITYKWIFSAFDCRVDEDGMQDVVTTVHWRYNGTNEDGISAEIYGAQSVGTPTPDAFTPYPDLSEEQVIGWMEETLDVEAMQLNLATQIELIINPVIITLPPPFANTEETIVINVDGEIGLAQLNPNAKLEVK
jgi:hypothetical protein